MAREYARIFVRGHSLFREANSFPRAKLEENCDYQEQIMAKDKYLSIFSCQIVTIVFIILQIFFATHAVLKIGEYSRIFPSFMGNIRSRDAFRPIARKQKDLMDYNSEYHYMKRKMQMNETVQKLNHFSQRHVCTQDYSNYSLMFRGVQIFRPMVISAIFVTFSIFSLFFGHFSALQNTLDLMTHPNV